MVQLKSLSSTQATQQLPPSVQAATQRSQLLADVLNQNLSSHNINSYGQLAAELGATWLNNRTAKKANADLSTAMADDRKSKLGAILAAIDTSANPGVGVSQQASAPQGAPQSDDPFASIISKAQQEAPPAQAALAAALSDTPQNRSNGKSPLGVRQNNPGNIRDVGIPWQGRTGSGGGFVTFDTPENGLRAMARNLMTYGKRGDNSVQKIVGKWAPSSENDTAAYIDNVAKRMGADPSAVLNMKDPAVMQSLMGAMIQQENGQMPYSPQQLQAGIAAGMGRGQAQAPVAPQAPVQQQPVPVQQQAPVQQPQAQAPAPQPAQPQPMQQAPQQQQFGGPLDATPQELAFIKQAAASGDPAMYQQAMALGQKIVERRMAPRKFDVQNINGVPTWVDPYNPGQMQTGSVPQGAMNRTVSGQELGIPGVSGAAYTVDPTGKPTALGNIPMNMQANGNSLGPLSGGQQDPVSPMNKLEALKSFRGEIKPTLDLATSLRRNVDAVRSGYRQQNGPGDIAMVNGLQKLIDEGVVREGDVNLQLKAQGINGGIASVLAYLTSSGKFDDAIRKKIAATAEDLYSSINTTYKDRVAGYKGIVERTYGQGAFNDVLPPETANALGWTGQPQQMQAPTPVQQPAASPMQKPKVRTYSDDQIRVVK